MIAELKKGEILLCKYGNQYIPVVVDDVNWGKLQVDVVPYGNYIFGIDTVPIESVIKKCEMVRDWYFNRYLPIQNEDFRKRRLDFVGRRTT